MAAPGCQPRSLRGHLRLALHLTLAHRQRGREGHTLCGAPNGEVSGHRVSRTLGARLDPSAPEGRSRVVYTQPACRPSLQLVSRWFH